MLLSEFSASLEPGKSKNLVRDPHFSLTTWSRARFRDFQSPVRAADRAQADLGEMLPPARTKHAGYGKVQSSERRLERLPPTGSYLAALSFALVVDR